MSEDPSDRTDLRCRAAELRLAIEQKLERLEHGPSPELDQRHGEERHWLEGRFDTWRGEDRWDEEQRTVWGDKSQNRDPEATTLRFNLEKRQYGEAEAFMAKIDNATAAGPLDEAKLAQFKDDVQRLYDGFSKETDRYMADHDAAKVQAAEWQALEKAILDRDPKMSR